MSTKLAFFDFDGTLCAPRFLVDGEYVNGVSDKDWRRIRLEQKEQLYNHCIPVEAVISKVKEFADNGIPVFVLTASGVDETAKHELTAKCLWLSKLGILHLFTGIIGSDGDAAKNDAMQSFADQYEVSRSECLLVEDTFTNVISARTAGFDVVHVSEIFVDWSKNA